MRVMKATWRASKQINPAPKLLSPPKGWPYGMCDCLLLSVVGRYRLSFWSLLLWSLLLNVIVVMVSVVMVISVIGRVRASRIIDATCMTSTAFYFDDD